MLRPLSDATAVAAVWSNLVYATTVWSSTVVQYGLVWYSTVGTAVQHGIV